MDSVTMNGRTFREAKRGHGAAQSASDLDGGAFERFARRVDFYYAGRLVAAFTVHGVLGKATPQADGRVWYSYGDPDGIGAHSMADSSAWRSALGAHITGWKGGEPVYSYKPKPAALAA